MAEPQPLPLTPSAYGYPLLIKQLLHTPLIKMLKFARRLGFELRRAADDPDSIHVWRALQPGRQTDKGATPS